MKLEPKIELYKVRNAGTIVTDSISFIKTNFKSLFSSLLYISAPALLLGVVGSTLFFNKYLSFYSLLTNFAPQNFSNTMTSDIMYLIFYICIMVLGLTLYMGFASTVTYCYIKHYQQNLEITTSLLWQSTKKYIWKVLGAQILFGLLLMGCILLCSIPIIIILSSLENRIILAGVSVFLAILLLACITPFLMIKLTFNQLYIIIEDKGILESFRLSYKFTLGIFWKTFLSLFLVNILISIASNLFQAPGYIYSFFIAITGFSEGGENTSSFNSLLSSALITAGIALSYLLYTVMFVAICIIYYSTIEERYGIGAKKSLNEIGKEE